MKGYSKWRLAFGVTLLVLVFVPVVFAQQKPVRVGFPMMLSGAGGLVGQPVMRGAEMLVREINEKGGVLGRRLELLVRDTRGTADEAARLSRDLVARDGADFLVGGLRAADVMAISTVAREHKLLYISPVSKSTAALEPGKVSPYVFRTAISSQTEGRTAAVEMAKLPVTRVYGIAPDDEYGQALTKAFADQLRKLKPEAQIVGQGWPRPQDHDCPPFIVTALAAKPQAIFSALWGSQFAVFARQAKPFGLFEKVRVVATGEAGSPEMAMTLKDDLPLGIVTNAYDIPRYDPVPEHKEYVERLKAFTAQEHPSSWASLGYVAMQFLVEAIQKAGTTDTETVVRALEGLTIQGPMDRLTMRAKDHQSTRGQFWGVTARAPEYAVPILNPVRYVTAEEVMD